MFNISEQRKHLWQRLCEDLSQKERSKESLLQQLEAIKPLERFWAFPGESVFKALYYAILNEQFEQAKTLSKNVVKQLNSPFLKSFKPFVTHLETLRKINFQPSKSGKPCVELLILHPDPSQYFTLYLQSLLGQQREKDTIYYELVMVSSLADAVCCLMNNTNIQAVIGLSYCAQESDCVLTNKLASLFQFTEEDSAKQLSMIRKQLRPDIPCFYLSTVPFAELEVSYFLDFDKVLYHETAFRELHYNILTSIQERFNTPFFNALKAYSQSDKEAFHALPISHGNSVKNSPWTKDYYHFYGANLFDAETSSTQGGLDSLLSPKGAIKNAQIKAQNAFGSQQTFFVTNGTSTANKIVMQANLVPRDIAMISSDCHKSAPYGAILSGVHVLFLQTEAIYEFDLYGTVPLSQIEQKMRTLEAQGVLSQLKYIMLTNSTFDGALYDVETYMMRLLAIKPDLIFHWDEAWFAHGHFHPLYRKRHAMGVAQKLAIHLRSESYRTHYAHCQDKTGLPDPDQVKIRVYATQSTHKTLSCFRQGSMIHVWDECFQEHQFTEAYYTHTTTSPNYQILASMDIARRQMVLEGYELIQNALILSNNLKTTLQEHPVLKQMYYCLKDQDIVIEDKIKTTHAVCHDEALKLLTCFQQEGVRFDPTRITLDIRKTGLDGEQFRKLLIDCYDIQINKTSKYTVLFIINIGVRKESIQRLIHALLEIAEQPKMLQTKPAKSILPVGREYAPQYRFSDSLTDIVDLRTAYYDGLNTQKVEFLPLTEQTLLEAKSGKTWVSAGFITPYPPGFPLFIPGQIIQHQGLLQLYSLLGSEIHGLIPDQGLKILQTERTDNT